MHVRNLHEWDVEASRAMEVQEMLRAQISLKDSLDCARLRWVGGADVSYVQGKETIYGAVVVLSFPDLRIVEERWVRGESPFPTFLAF